jgi:hypothetical protein
MMIVLPIALLLSAPLWHRLIYPAGYAEVRCVIQETDGSVVKGFDETACLKNGKPTLVLRMTSSAD